MTDKVVNGNGKWFWPIYLALIPVLLTVIGGMVWAQMQRLQQIQETQQKYMDVMRANQHEISFILWQDPDTSPDSKKRLDDIYRSTRGGSE